jgi:subtilisin-like proprotein convertase family protein
MKRTILFTLLLLSARITFSQTYSSTPNQQINDNATTDYDLTVSGLVPSNLDTANFGLESICINLTHTWVGDLNIYLVAPDGTITSLTVAQGGDGDNYTNTCFDPNAPQLITQTSPPFTGNFGPMGQLGTVNNGQNGNGIWKLRIVDTYPADDGTLLNWSITFGTNPASYFSISSSDLPIFVINTNGQTIPDEPRISANMGVIWNYDTARNYVSAPFNHYNLRVGIETRGASSGGFAKKSYRIELWDQNNIDIDAPLVGFPSENDWVLSAQYTDKTLMRGMMTFDLIRKMGWWAPRTKPVELILNGEYQGVYLLMEKVKRSPDRIDIAKLNQNETFGDDLTGGYIIKLDKNSGQSSPGWTSPYAPWPSGSDIVFNYEYPDADLIVPEQITYIQSYIDSFETALAGPDFMDPTVGYRNFVDINSCVDAFIIQEYTKSIDAYRKSFFMYKDKDSKNGKLVMAPVWDYDLSYGNVNFCEGESYNGWQYNFNYICGGDYWLNPFWFERMTQDPYFNLLVRCRWEELRQDILSDATVNNWIDSTATVLNESQEWNFKIWPIMGTYVWPNYYIGQTYQEEVDTLKWWIGNRALFIDSNLPSANTDCALLASVEEQANQQISTYPNPFNSFFECTLFTERASQISVTITNILGVQVYEEKVDCEMGTNKIRIEPKEQLSSGAYLLKISDRNRSWTKKIIVE